MTATSSASSTSCRRATRCESASGSAPTSRAAGLRSPSSAPASSTRGLSGTRGRSGSGSRGGTSARSARTGARASGRSPSTRGRKAASSRWNAPLELRLAAWAVRPTRRPATCTDRVRCISGGCFHRSARPSRSRVSPYALSVIRIAEEVRDARAVVVLETTLVAHGFPPGEGVEVGLESERQGREAGAGPAPGGVLDGEIVVGLTREELERFGADARKVGPRDLAAAVAQRAMGATTVGGTLAVARATGLRFMATGGLGGVHRGFPHPPDVSADLAQLARTPALVVSAGVKSLLDVPATSEVLESLGIPVLGYGVDTLPLFYVAAGGPSVSARISSPDDSARIARAHWDLGGTGILVGRPPDESLDDVEPLIEQALRAAQEDGVSGQAVTPYVLAYLHRESGGRTQRANKDLIAQNSRLAGEIAVAASS